MNENEFGFGGWGLVILIAIFFLLFGGGWGNNGAAGRVGEAYATQADIQRAVDLDTLKSGQASIVGSVKDAAYSNLSEMRDIQMGMTEGFANMQKCCCETLRAIDSVNYNGALNTASINATTTAATQKILDKLSADREADLLQRVNQLETQNMFCGIPRISPYGYGVVPQFAAVPNGCGCGCGNI